jgi:cyclopropane fatty-acyl-phospholipid synthase-like methyltransferase
MENQRPFSGENLKSAKESIHWAQGYLDKGLEAYSIGLGVESFENFEGMKVLDLGAAAHLQFARGLEKAGIRADIVSFSPAFADKNWSDNIKNRKESDKVVAGMGEELPFADDTFDRVVCLDVVEHLGTYERYIVFLKEIARILAPNGVAYIAPIVEMQVSCSATVIPKGELEKILENKVDVSYQLVQEVLRNFRLTLQKR